MGRVKGYIEVEGRKLWTLFDSGSLNTYIVEDAVGSLPVLSLSAAQICALGGRTHVVTRNCALEGRVEGYVITALARIVADIGVDEEGRRIEVLFGALAMQNYGIKIDVKNERLDFTHYPKEFIEFYCLENSVKEPLRL